MLQHLTLQAHKICMALALQLATASKLFLVAFPLLVLLFQANRGILILFLKIFPFLS